MKYGALALFALFVGVAACAAASEAEAIHRLYQRGLAGDKQAVDECIAKLA